MAVVAVVVAVVATVVALSARAGLAAARGERTAANRRAERAEEGAAQSDAVRRRLALALDAMAEGVVLTDEDGQVVLRNLSASAYRDPRRSDALVVAAVEELLERALEGRPGSQPLELFGPPARTLVVRAEPLVGEDGPAGALATVEDVTERRRLEAVRRDFVANISHELRTPVGALSLLAEALAAEEDPEAARRLAGRVVDEAHRMSRTIDDLLALTRIETEDDPVRQPVPVRVVVAEAVGRVEHAAAERGIGIEVAELDPGLVVPGDRRQLVSALANLVDNAVKYSEDGSVVAVEVAEAPGEVALAVRDRGVGIPAADLDRVFERFYRVDAARSRATGGTGLGLAIVRHVARNHHGEVALESQLGEGSTFTLHLPTETSPDPGGTDPHA